MVLLTPIWLLLLVPWAALAVWLSRGRGRDEAVPFIELWRPMESSPAVSRRWRLPPAHLLLALAGLLGAILAAARPAVTDTFWRKEPVPLIVDRGYTRSAPPDSPIGNFSVARDLRFYIHQPLDLLFIPGDEPVRTGWSDFPPAVLEASATALDTRPLLERAVRSRLAAGTGPVIVLSDQSLSIDDPRFVQVTPPRPPINVGIAHVAFRPHPAPQAMVRVLNQSDRRTATLLVGDQSREIELPPSGTPRDYFIDLPAGADEGDGLHVRLDVTDELPLDNEAWLVRTQFPPRVEVAGTVDPAVRRMADVYSRLRPPTSASPRVHIRPADEPSPLAGALLADRFDAQRGGGSVEVAAHALTAGIDWPSALPADLRLATPPDDAGWEPLLRVDGRPVLAVRERPARQVWIGFDQHALATEPAFVILWTNLLDWLAGGEERWAADAPQTLPDAWQRLEPLPGDVRPGWLPGLYRDTDGRLRAIHTPARLIPDPPQIDWPQRLQSLTASLPTGTPLSPHVLLAALACLTLAAVTWPRRK